MLCQNCGEDNANIKYTQIINGIKKEMVLCDKCSKELGVNTLDFNMPINLSSFLGEFLEDEKELLPNFIKKEDLICNKCKMTYDEFINKSKFGCEHCYEMFSKRIDPVLKNIHGANRHVGRTYLKKQIQNKELKTEEKVYKEEKIDNDENKKINELKQNLKKAIKDERYEEAAKIRDEIKKIESK